MLRLKREPSNGQLGQSLRLDLLDQADAILNSRPEVALTEWIEQLASKIGGMRALKRGVSGVRGLPTSQQFPCQPERTSAATARTRFTHGTSEALP